MNIYMIECVKVFAIVFAGWLLYKVMYPIRNKDIDVKYPYIKVNIIGKTIKKSDLIEYCAVKMYKGGVAEKEVMEFIEKAFKAKSKEQLLDLFVNLFYIY